MSLRASRTASRSLSPAKDHSLSSSEHLSSTSSSTTQQRAVKRVPSFGSRVALQKDENMDSSSSHHKSLSISDHHHGGKRRKSSFRRTSYWVVLLTGITLHISVMLSNFVVFDILGGKRDIQFASLLWGIMNTAISCMNLSMLRNFIVPILAKCTSSTTEATRMLFDETLTEPMSRLWIGLLVGVCFTYAATGFGLPPWTQLRFSATSYTVAVAWAFSLLSTFQQLSSGE